MCPKWTASVTLCRKSLGRTILCPLKILPSILVNSSLWFQYSNACLGDNFQLFGQPSCTSCVTTLIWGSACVADVTSSILLLLFRLFYTTMCTCKPMPADNCGYVSGKNCYDSISAIGMSFPGMCIWLKVCDLCGSRGLYHTGYVGISYSRAGKKASPSVTARTRFLMGLATLRQMLPANHLVEV